MALNVLHANDRPGSHPPSWYAATASLPPATPPLAGRERADVCVIGGGYTGLSAALHLAESGLRVVLIEAHRVGWGASGRNGGQVATGQRRGQDEIEARYGATMARRLWDFAEEAKALVRELISRHAIACQPVAGIIHADHKARFVAHSRAYADKLNAEYGYDAIRFLDRDAIRALVASPGYHGGTLDTGAFHLHPLDYALGLAAAAGRAGVRIRENSEVIAIERGDPATVRTAAGEVVCGHVIVACNGYLDRLVPEIASHVMPINNFIIATEPLGEAGARALIANNAAVADSRFVINYFRLTGDNRLLFGGGESYGYRFPSDIAAFVRQPMLRVFPQLAATRIDHAWGGTLAITMGRLPHLTRIAGNMLSASGYSGQGIAIATLAGKVVAEAVRGQAQRFDLLAAIAQPAFPGGAALRAPLLALAMTWYALRDRL
ncbi:MAG: gamma-glutamylputrescine oxidase [Alphaproteobacteria bacterium]|nr:MAG: gamma-glutamylputrescine oxidase [Alphaproteobacteria bacterium]